LNKINAYENILRTLIILILEKEFGSNYSDHFGVTHERLQKWRDKRDQYTRKMWETITERRIIYFSDF